MYTVLSRLQVLPIRITQLLVGRILALRDTGLEFAEFRFGWVQGLGACTWMLQPLNPTPAL